MQAFPTLESMKQRIDEMNRLVVLLSQKGKYKQAIDLALPIRDLSQKIYGENHPRFAASLNNLGELYRQGFRLVVISSGFARNLAGQNEISRSARNDKRKS